MHGLLRLLLLLAGIAAAIGVAAATLPLARFPVERPPTVPNDHVAVVERIVDLSRPAQVELTWVARPDVRIGTGGVITSIAVQAGQAVACGAVVAIVDDRPVIAFCGPQPLWREVGPGAVGADAAAVRAFLVEVDALQDSNATTQEFVDAVGVFRRDRGLPPSDTLGPENLAWIGGEHATVGTIAAQAGETVVPTDVLMTLAPELRSARLVETPDDRPSSDFSFAVTGQDNGFAISSEGAIVDVDALAASLGDVALSTDPVPDRLDGYTRLVEPLTAWAIPATAVISSGATTCVRLVGGSDAPVPIEVIDYVAGTAMVTGDLDSGVIAVADPGDQQCS